ncbi:MAG TPA: UPF0182 family protein [Bryobacteraceae bacterium]|nr:UPF0182 family protein [Bryobacteraceae bacterium]
MRTESDRYIGQRQRRRSGLFVAAVILFILFVASRWIASTVIDYAWWGEMHQLETWVSLLIYGFGPIVLTVILLLASFWIAYWVGIRRNPDRPLFGVFSRSLVSKIAFLALLVLAIIAANATVDNWTVVRYFGGLRVPTTPGEFVDPIFGNPLQFYFFRLPFYSMLLRVVLTGAILSLIVYWLAAHAENLYRQLPNLATPASFEFETRDLSAAFNSNFVRVIIALVLLSVALEIFFHRYGLLFDDHGTYLVGVDWVADHIVIPLQWTMIAGAIVAAILVLARRAKFALLFLLLLPVRFFVPSIMAAVYVRPNELALERPYIQHHIEATRSAYGLNASVKETTLEAAPEVPLDYASHKALLDNVRLWDFQAFHDTLSQIQPLRPYVYLNTDVDRYIIDGNIRQVLVSPRELDIRQLGAAANRWINTHLIYTHGYGIVMAEANRITPDGLPFLLIKNAPPEISVPSLHFTKPEIYYSEEAHEPVFVSTSQSEFNYPSGSQSVYTTYSGTGGIPVSALNRFAATVAYGDLNTLLTSNLTDHSRMMIHRPIMDRLHTLAGFLTWDADPYLVLTDSGRLVWMIDGYMSSNQHPYSRELSLGDQQINYIRNSVKATIDAYTGETNMYVFAPNDVLIQAYWRLFPQLFKPESAMPPDLRRHARYPETLFSAQAEIYRAFHMRDAESFYNRADMWDIARSAGRNQGGTESSSASPTYVVAALPDSDTPEFMLLNTFTPAGKDNLIGVMYARCDGAHLGELVFEQLSKQNIIFGPIQIDARINQDQTISKDLSLWNQQGSQVLRGQTLVLPINNSFLYVEPIYIQASQASMPQLKKVALAMGNLLAYADTYEQSLQELIAVSGGVQNVPQQRPSPQTNSQAAPAPPALPKSNAINTPQPSTPPAEQTLQQVRAHLQRYKDFSAQGKWADAGKELDEIQKLLQKQ